MKKRSIAFLLSLVLVFAASLAIWSPERLAQTARENANADSDEWVGYFLARSEIDGVYQQYRGKKYWGTRTEDGSWDFGIPGSACFISLTEISPQEPEYEENSAFNFAVAGERGEGVTSGGMNIRSGDDGERYEIEATMTFAEVQETSLFAALDVYRTGNGEYYIEAGTFSHALGANSAGSVTCTRSVNIGGRTRTISVSLSAERRPAVARAAFIWLDGEKTVLAREEFSSGALPGEVKAPEGAALLILAEEQLTSDGTVTVRTAFTKEDMSAALYVAAESEGLLNARYVSLSWEE